MATPQHLAEPALSPGGGVTRSVAPTRNKAATRHAYQAASASVPLERLQNLDPTSQLTKHALFRLCRPFQWHQTHARFAGASDDGLLTGRSLREIGRDGFW